MTVGATVETVRSADGTSIAFERTGTGPALILVDATLGYRGFGPMGPLGAQLASSFTVITYDRRGRGESRTRRRTRSSARSRTCRPSWTWPVGRRSRTGSPPARCSSCRQRSPVSHFRGWRSSSPRCRSRTSRTNPTSARRSPSSSPPVAAETRSSTSTRASAFREEMLAGMRDAPFWPALEQAAHTLVYDTTITSSLPLDRLSGITTTTLVLSSEGSDERLPTWGRWLHDRLPDSSFRTLEGEWHGVSPENLAPVLREFFTAGGEV